MAWRVSADWAHKCWAPVLAAAAAVSGRTLGVQENMTQNCQQSGESGERERA